MGANEILLSAASGGLVVVSGALYALCFALGRLRGSRTLRGAAWLAYGALVICVLVLARQLDLSGGWRAVVVVMLVGYWFAPRAIWRLSQATHPADRNPSPLT